MKKLLMILLCLVMLLGVGCAEKAASEAVNRYQLFSFGSGNRSDVHELCGIDRADLQFRAVVFDEDGETIHDITEDWSLEKYNSFIAEILEFDIGSWGEDYTDPQKDDVRIWDIYLFADNDEHAISAVFNEHNLPDRWDEFLDVLSQYFGYEVKQNYATN